MLLRKIREFQSRIESKVSLEDENTTHWKINLLGHEMTFFDVRGSITAEAVYREIMKDELGLLKVQLKQDAVVIDIGANIGIPSIYLAKKFPQAKFYLFEPILENYRNLQKNIKANGIDNIVAENLAITSDGRDFPMTALLCENSGGGTGQAATIDSSSENPNYLVSKSIKLDDVFERHAIEHCDLLKIDCEGSEHEILETFSYLDRVRSMIGEIHLNTTLESKGYSLQRIQNFLKPLGPKNYKIKCIRMAE